MKREAPANAGAFVMPDVRAVVFDVGRVLFQWDLRHLFAPLIEDPERLEWFVTCVVSEQWHHQHDEGRDLDELVAERIAQFPDCADLIRIYATRFNDSVPGPVPGTAQLVERLAARDMPLFALTNFAAKFWDEFRPLHPVFDYFRDVVVSGVEKLAKPDPAIYRLAQRRFGHTPGELFFIDDNPANVAAARACGWQASLFTDAASLERELLSRGLLA